ncbi:MAG: type II secretion system GspH family protein [Planctomycetes bacterium]|nr:type II secretion system GspH family protein [Planctomycetota bacterium]MBU1517610.1 type II secretion system GspH family protein [Planctomycetota bacterium]
MKGFTMKTKKKKNGFTIVELLTVMAVIAMLMGILVPALNLVRRLAKDTNQRAQFHGIEVGLEAYVSENEGRYPESTALNTGTGNMTVGAQKLAEALIGRDMLGLDPNTTWDADYDETNPCTYASKSLKGSSDTQVTDSLKRRQGPYLDVSKTEAFQVGQLFTNTYNVYDGLTTPAPVLTDTYRAKKVVMQGKTMMAGTPILYYKANAASLTFPDTNDVTAIANPDCNDIYCSLDNEELIVLGTMNNPSKPHNFAPDYEAVGKGTWYFYDTITNKQITSLARPFNPDSYILMSAGYDGIYGTRDDIYNFD